MDHNQEQLEALRDMQNFLSRYCLELTEKHADYKEWAEDLFDTGVDKRIAEKFADEFCPEVAKSINGIIDMIEGEQSDVIRDKIQKLES